MYGRSGCALIQRRQIGKRRNRAVVVHVAADAAVDAVEGRQPDLLDVVGHRRGRGIRAARQQSAPEAPPADGAIPACTRDRPPRARPAATRSKRSAAARSRDSRRRSAHHDASLTAGCGSSGQACHGQYSCQYGPRIKTPISTRTAMARAMSAKTVFCTRRSRGNHRPIVCSGLRSRNGHTAAASQQHAGDDDATDEPAADRPPPQPNRGDGQQFLQPQKVPRGLCRIRRHAGIRGLFQRGAGNQTEDDGQREHREEHQDQAAQQVRRRGRRRVVGLRPRRPGFQAGPRRHAEQGVCLGRHGRRPRRPRATARPPGR